MAQTGQNSALEGVLVGLGALTLGLYFTFHAVQGDDGLFSRLQIEAEAEALRAEKATLEAELANLSNRARRLSDAYLDLDLLDERVRAVLGYVHPDDIVVQ